MKAPLLPALVLLTAGAAALAQAPASNQAGIATTGAGASRATDRKVESPDGIARVKDTTVYIKSGDVTRVSTELKLSEGIIARPSGEVVLPGGKTIMLAEGQMVTLDGKMISAPIGLGSTAPGSASVQPPDSGPKSKFGNGLPPVSK